MGSKVNQFSTLVHIDHMHANIHKQVHVYTPHTHTNTALKKVSQ